MQATLQDIEYLERLQEIDLEINRTTKQFEELPQRKMILDAREKSKSLASKQAQIESLKKESNKKITRITDEDASLAKKEKGVQAAIEAAGNDFRGVEARSKELDGIFKRRATLKEDLESAKAEASKIDELNNQVTQAIASTMKQEQDATESFKAQGGALKAKLSSLESERGEIVESLSEEVSKAYIKTSEHTGSVTVGKLEGNRCGVCRATIESGHLISLKNEAPLGICPSCTRLLIIS